MGLIGAVRGKFSTGGTLVLQSIVVIGALMLLNMWAYQLQFQWDASEGSVHTLSASTLEILATLDRPVKIIVIDDDANDQREGFLKRFEHASELVETAFLVFEENATLVKEKYGIESGNAIIVECGEQWRKLPAARSWEVWEQNIAGAILQMVKGAGKRVLFATGHGEKAILGNDPAALSEACVVLRAAGYATVEGEINEDTLGDATVLVIAAPQEELTDEEASFVTRFVQQGGSVLIMLQPPPAAGLLNVLAPFGMGSAEDFVVERDKRAMHEQLRNTTSYIGAYHPKHPLGQRMTMRMLMTNVRSLTILRDRPEGAREVLPLCKTSPHAFGETTIGGKGWKLDETDHGGPRILAAATTEDDTESTYGHVLVTGTDSFMTNRFSGASGNRTFVELAVGWLAGDLDYPLVLQKEPYKPLNVTEAERPRLFLACVVGLPGLSALTGLIVFFRRSRRSN